MTAEDPIARFHESFARARTSESFDASRVALATADRTGQPSVRFVLLKHADAAGFVFYTNLESRKARELTENPRAALSFHWASIGEQIRVEGRVERVSDAEADAYFAKRPRGSQLGACASKQSSPIASREELEQRVAALDREFAGRPVPRPPFWGGFRVVPTAIEFWYDRQDRLHDRFLYQRTADGGWVVTRLSP
jgi:pyridoxamine 5'-phosphate oxidase